MITFVFGSGGEGSKESEGPNERTTGVSTRRVLPTSYKEKLLSLEFGGYLVKHNEDEDIVNGWKSFFAKKHSG